MLVNRSGQRRKRLSAPIDHIGSHGGNDRVLQPLISLHLVVLLYFAIVVTMGHKIIVSPGSPFTVDNIPFGVIKTAKDNNSRCASAIGEYAIDLSLYSQGGNLDGVKGDADLVEVFSQVCTVTAGVTIPIYPPELLKPV